MLTEKKAERDSCYLISIFTIKVKCSEPLSIVTGKKIDKRNRIESWLIDLIGVEQRNQKQFNGD